MVDGHAINYIAPLVVDPYPRRHKIWKLAGYLLIRKDYCEEKKIE